MIMIYNIKIIVMDKIIKYSCENDDFFIFTVI